MIKFPIILALIIQAFLCLLISAFFLSELYRKEIQNYGYQSNDSFQFSINSLASDKIDDTRELLLNSQGTLLRQIPQYDSKGSYSLNIQVGGVVNDAPTLEFLGKKIINSSDLKMLINSKNPNATIGTSIGSKNTLKEIPNFLFATPIYFSKLSTSLETTVLGNYTLLGRTPTQRLEFLTALSSVSGISKEELLVAKSGYTLDNGLLGIILAIGLGFTFLIVGILTVTYTLSSIKEIGSLSLLGWGKFQMISRLYRFVFLLSLILIPINMIISLLLYTFNTKILVYSLISGIVNMIFVLFILAISSLIVLSVNPMNAIKGILPKKILYSFIIFLYLLSSIGLVSVSYALDGPINQVSQNKKLLTAWKNVNSYETLANVSPGENQSSIAGLDDTLDHEMYNWYQSIETNDGVYYVTSQYYDNKLIDNIQIFSSQSHAVQPFTFMSASPNYIQDHINNIPKNLLQKANQGVRIFLIPDNRSEKEYDSIKKWLTETILNELNNTSFKNDFSIDKHIEFAKYHVSSDIFTWATQNKEPAFTKDLIISIVTTNNMTPFDAGNLRANVLTGPLKFKNKKTMIKNTKNLTAYHLEDNKLSFIPVNSFVDGLQKNLLKTISFFGSVIIFIMVMILLIILAMALIFSIINERTIFVKQLLGFSRTKIYKNIILFILFTGVIELFIVLFLKNILGVVLVPTIVILQLLTIQLFIKKHMIEKIKGH